MTQNLRRVLIALVTLAVSATALTPVVIAKNGGNSAASAACENGGYLNWTTATGDTFKNEGACVNYAAKGGILATAGADVSLYAFPGVEISILVQNAGPLATSLTVRVDASAETGNQIGPIFASAPDGWECVLVTSNVVDCSVPSLAAGATAVFSEARFDRFAAWTYEVTAAGVFDPDSTPGNGVTTEDDYLVLPATQ